MSTPQTSTEVREKILTRVAAGPGGCWLWTGPLISSGYASVKINRKTYLGHRLMCPHPIPLGWHVDHLCRVRSCVRPDHLEAVTPLENNLRVPRRPFCNRGHAYSENSAYTKQGHRYCAQCARERAAEAKARKRLEGAA